MAAGGSKQLTEVLEIERLKQELGELKEQHAEKLVALSGVKEQLDETKKSKQDAFKKLQKSDDISMVVLGASAFMRLARHCGACAPEVASGELLGRVEVLEGNHMMHVTTSVPRKAGASFADGISPRDKHVHNLVRAYGTMRTDHTHVGWYRSSMHASHWTADTLHRMMRDSSSEAARLYGDRFIVLVFDVLDVAAPQRVRAYTLSPTAAARVAALQAGRDSGEHVPASVDALDARVWEEGLVAELPVFVQSPAAYVSRTLLSCTAALTAADEQAAAAAQGPDGALSAAALQCARPAPEVGASAAAASRDLEGVGQLSLQYAAGSLGARSGEALEAATAGLEGVVDRARQGTESATSRELELLQKQEELAVAQAVAAGRDGPSTEAAEGAGKGSAGGVAGPEGSESPEEAAKAAAVAAAEAEAAKIRREAAAHRAQELQGRLKGLQDTTRSHKLAALVGVSAAEEGGAAVAATARETMGRLVLAEAMHKAVEVALQ